MRLLALDLDGTLLQRDGSIAVQDLEAITRAQAAGIVVTIITGRMYAGTVAAAQQIRAHGPVGCVDGCHLVDGVSGATLQRATLRAAVAQRALAAFADADLATFAFGHDVIWHNAAGTAFAPYVATWAPQLRGIDGATATLLDHMASASEAPMGLLALGTLAQLTAAAEAVHPHVRAQAFSVQFALTHDTASPWRGMYGMLVRAHGHDKGTALHAICAHHGVEPQHAVVVGDWLNDVPMFAAAGRAFVMAGAPSDVVARATDTLAARAGAGGGVAEAIAAVWGRL